MAILRGGRGPVGVALLLSLLLPGSVRPAAEPPAPVTPYFADRAFADVWNRTDAALVQPNRSWYWGPVQFSGPLVERMDGLPGGTRLVQYFDKSRMEINDPNGNRNSKWFVTNGLLTVELISGRMQVGVNPDRYEMRAPAEVAIAGDTLAENPDAPTYAGFAAVADTPLTPRPAANATGQQVVFSVSRSRPTPRNEGRYNRYAIYNAHYVIDTQHNIPGVFWQFLNARGSVVMNGQVWRDQPLSTPWYFATGYPISEAYWASVLINKQPTDVLIQAYQRRVLTYIPSYFEPWKVQMGNIGQHYVEWRYPDGLPGQARVYDTTGNGGDLCRSGLPAGSPCPAAAPADQSPNRAAYRDDTLRTRTGGTLGAQTRDAKFRLLSQSQMQIKWRTDLNPGQNFLYSLGEVLYDIGFHRNAQDEIVIDTGSTGIIRVAPQALAARALAPAAVAPGHLYLSLGKSRDGRLKLGAYRTAIPLVVAGRRFVLPANQQIHVAPSGLVSLVPEQLDAETLQLWATFSDDGNLDLPPRGPDPFNLATCRIVNPPMLTAAQRTRLGCAVTPVHRYDRYTPALAGTYGDPVAPSTLLFSDTLSSPPTLYALSTRATRLTLPAWDSYSDTAGTVRAQAGAPVVECNTGQWTIQRFAGGALIQPPVFSHDDVLGCSLDTGRFYILYQDGTWEEVVIVT